MNINGTYPMNDVELFENITVLPAEAVERIRKTSKAQVRAARTWKENNREAYLEAQRNYMEENQEKKATYFKNYYHSVLKPKKEQEKRLLKMAKDAGFV